MKITSLFLPLLLLGCSLDLNAQTSASTPIGSSAPEFETSGPVDAKAFIPASLMRGKLHSVGASASNNGLQNLYELTCGGRTTEILTTPLLIQRIREFYALESLRSLSKTEEFGKAMGKALGAKAESVVGLVKDPVGTAKSLPKGASRFFGGIGESLKGGKSNSEGSALDSLAGTEKAKAALALKLGVSPYTDNPELQEELTNTARVMAGGGLAVSLATSAATGGAGAALTVIGVNQTLQEALATSSPSELRIRNRKKLLALGLDRTEADEFLMHPQYSPWHQTAITEALVRIGASPKAFLWQTCRASGPEDAAYFQRVTQLLLKYHTTAAPLRSIQIQNGLICGLDKEGTLVVPVSLDYATWNERSAARVNDFRALSHGHDQIKLVSLWTDGQLSPCFSQELTKRGISWKVRALESQKE